MTEPLVEGPRRRARREREERRAAAARARAIEEARREAKRKATGATTAPKPVRRGVVRGLKVLTWGAVIAVLSVGLALLLYFTPIMSVRNLAIDGLAAIPRDEVVAAVGVRTGLRCCRSTPTRWPTGLRRFPEWPRCGCSANTLRRCG